MRANSRRSAPLQLPLANNECARAMAAMRLSSAVTKVAGGASRGDNFSREHTTAIVFLARWSTSRSTSRNCASLARNAASAASRSVTSRVTLA